MTKSENNESNLLGAVLVPTVSWTKNFIASTNNIFERNYSKPNILYIFCPLDFSCLGGFSILHSPPFKLFLEWFNYTIFV